MSKWIRKDVEVIAISGNEKGRKGKVIARRGDRVVVEGFNVRTKHVKPANNQPGRIAKIEAPMHVSNLALCSEDGTRLKPKVRINSTGDRELVTTAGEDATLVRTLRKSRGQK